MAAISVPNPTDAYRRDARKLRGQLAHRPLELYRSLRDLSDRHDAVQTFANSTPAPVSPAMQFAEQVRIKMDEGLLTYSARAALVREAEAVGIKRFEANLIIAAVQHQRPRVSFLPRRKSNFSRLQIAALLILTQIVTLLALWSIAQW